MQKQTFLKIVFIIGIVLTISQGQTAQLQLQVLPSVCAPDQYYTPKGCWSSCSAPKYNQCGDMFTLEYNPSFCAYNKDGTYTSYTHECQACKNPDVLAVTNGACADDAVEPIIFDQCSLMRCPFGTVCQNGECKPIDRCLSVLCRQGFYCQNGACIFKPSSNCGIVPCPQGSFCRMGRCVPQFDLCATVKCYPDTVCRGGQCVPIQPTIISPVSPVEDLCANIFCIATSTCIKGVCVPLAENILVAEINLV